MGKIKTMLSKIFNNTFVDKESIEYKIAYIKENPPDIYSSDMFINKITTIEKDIIAYINNIKEYITSDYINCELNVKRVSTNNIKKVRLAEWFSDNKYILDNPLETLNTFLDMSKELITITDKMLSNAENFIPYNNGYMLQPYVNNIKDIIEELYLISKSI